MTAPPPRERKLARWPGCSRGGGPVDHTYGGVAGGPLRKLNGMHQAALAGRHLLAIGYALFIACSTMLPTGTDLVLFVFDLEKLANPWFVGHLVVVSALIGGLALAVLTWWRRRTWIPRLSWPLVAYVMLCGIALATLVVISQPPRYLARVGLGELRGIAADLDVRHIISYFGFAVVAAIAWRARISLPVLGLLLMAYGFGLELLQEFVPSRNFRIKDLVSNGLGILLGLFWVYLYDSLFGAAGTRLSRSSTRRRGGALARAGGAGSDMQPRRS